MGKTEDARQKLFKEMGLTDELLKNGGITEEQHKEVYEFLRSELRKLDQPVELGFSELSRAIQMQSREEISRSLGMDISSFKSIFQSFVASSSMPMDTAMMVSTPYKGQKWTRYSNYGSDEYKRQITGRWSDDAPESIPDIPAVYATNIGLTYEGLTRDLADAEAELFLGEVKRAMDAEEIAIFRGIFRPTTSDPTELIGRYGYGAAEIIWKEYGGIILCECDSGDCDSRVNVTHDEYIHASGHGQYYRVTHPDCSYGVLGATLIERSKNYHVWTKMA